MVVLSARLAAAQAAFDAAPMQQRDVACDMYGTAEASGEFQDWTAANVACGVRRFDKVLGRSLSCYEREQAKRAHDMRVPNLVADILQPDPNDRGRVVTGRDRLNLIRKTLDSYGLDRSDTQREFHDCMIGAAAQLIFKDDLEEELDDLLQELGVEELHSEFMAITPRRWGKTYSVAMFVVACALGIEGCEQAIFSTGRRASQKLLELVYSFICRIPGMKEMIVKHNVETIWLKGPNGDTRKIFSYPSKVKISSVRACTLTAVFARRPPTTKRKRIADETSNETDLHVQLDHATRLCVALVAVCNTVSDAAAASGALRRSLLPPSHNDDVGSPQETPNTGAVYDKLHEDFARDSCALLALHRYRRAPPDDPFLLCRLVARLVTARADLVELSEYEERVFALLRRYIDVPCEENGDKYYAVDIYTVMRCASYADVFAVTPISPVLSIGTPSPHKRRGVPSPPIRTLCVGCHLIPRHRRSRMRLCGVCDDVGFVMHCVLQELVHMRAEFATHQPRFDQHDELLRAHLDRLQEICVPDADGVVRHRMRVAQLNIPE